MPSGCELFCEILIAVILPPLGVCLRHGCCTPEFLICLLLTILGYIPGIIYALYAIVFVNRDEFFDEHSLQYFFYALYTIVFINRDEFFDEHRRPLYYSSY